MQDNLSKYFPGIKNEIFKEYIPSLEDYRFTPEKTRILCFIAGSQACGEYEIMRGLINWALDRGVTIDTIYEILLQGHLFVGYPRALESFFVLDEICRESNLTPGAKADESWDQVLFRKRGLETARKIYSKNFDLVYNNIKKLAPQLGKGMIYEGYGRIISRPGAGIIDRELAIVSILTISDMQRQVYSHIRGAHNVGASPETIAEVIEQCLAFCPEKIIIKARSTMEKSLGISAFPE